MNRQVFQPFFFLIIFCLLFTIPQLSFVCAVSSFSVLPSTLLSHQVRILFVNTNNKKTTPKFLIIIQMDLMYFLMNVCVICVCIDNTELRVPLGYSSLVYVYSIAKFESFHFFIPFFCCCWWHCFDIEFDSLLWSVKLWKRSFAHISFTSKIQTRTLTLITPNIREKKNKITTTTYINRSHARVSK